MDSRFALGFSHFTRFWDFCCVVMRLNEIYERKLHWISSQSSRQSFPGTETYWKYEILKKQSFFPALYELQRTGDSPRFRTLSSFSVHLISKRSLSLSASYSETQNPHFAKDCVPEFSGERRPLWSEFFDSKNIAGKCCGVIFIWYINPKVLQPESQLPTIPCSMKPPFTDKIKF